MKKFQLVGWVPQKLGPFFFSAVSSLRLLPRSPLPTYFSNPFLSPDIPVKLGDILTLDNWLGTGLKEGELALPEDSKPGSFSRLRRVFISLVSVKNPR